jgi:hypothetical protein
VLDAILARDKAMGIDAADETADLIPETAISGRNIIEIASDASDAMDISDEDDDTDAQVDTDAEDDTDAEFDGQEDVDEDEEIVEVVPERAVEKVGPEKTTTR